MALDTAVMSHHVTERSWGDTGPWPHRVLAIQAGADRFVTVVAFHGALLLSTLASSATS